MSGLIRFGVSIESDLLASFDRLVESHEYATRSEALRDMIREALVAEKIESQPTLRALGTLTIVYDHHANNLVQEMGNVQHDFHQLVLSVMHLHVSHDDCMEVIALNGIVSEIVELSNRILSLKGVKHGKLFITLPSSNI